VIENNRHLAGNRNYLRDVSVTDWKAKAENLSYREHKGLIQLNNDFALLTETTGQRRKEHITDVDSYPGSKFYFSSVFTPNNKYYGLMSDCLSYWNQVRRRWFWKQPVSVFEFTLLTCWAYIRYGVKYIIMYFNTNLKNCQIQIPSFVNVFKYKYYLVYFKYKYFSNEKNKFIVFPLFFILIHTLYNITASTRFVTSIYEVLLITPDFE